MATVVKTLRGSESNQGLSRSSNIVTVTRAASPTMTILVGDTVVISGVTPASFNGSLCRLPRFGLDGSTKDATERNKQQQKKTLHLLSFSTKISVLISEKTGSFYCRFYNNIHYLVVGRTERLSKVAVSFRSLLFDISIPTYSSSISSRSGNVIGP